MTGNVGASIDINRNAYNCYIQSRHQYANGTYTDYTARVNDWRLYGATCSWGIGADATYQAASYSATITGNIGASLDINRQVYYLTVTGDSSYIAGTTGSGYYRAGDTAAISATASSGNEFTGWSQTAGTAGAFGNAGAASTTFTLPSDNATVYASGKSSRYYIQNVTNDNCPTTLTVAYDQRDDQEYRIIKDYPLGCLMWDNLNIAGGTVLNSATSNLPSGYTFTLPASSINGFVDDNTAYVYNALSKYCYYNDSMDCSSYYSFKAAAAGLDSAAGDVAGDICPRGWRLLTADEMLNYVSWNGNMNGNELNESFNLTNSGYIYDSTLQYAGSLGSGVIWTSNYWGSGNASVLAFNEGYSDVVGFNTGAGVQVRCKAK